MIDRCICHKIPFLLILEKAKNKGYKNLESLKDGEKIANKCQLCNKYIEKMLQSGQTEFPLD